jgi:hypothetical protein
MSVVYSILGNLLKTNSKTYILATKVLVLEDATGSEHVGKEMVQWGRSIYLRYLIT